MERSNYTAAVQYFSAGLQANPKEQPADVFIARGYCWLQLKKFTNALFDLRQGVWLEPTNLGALMNLGGAEIELGRYDEALGTFDKVLQMNTNNVDAIGRRGYALMKKKEYGAAIAELKRVLEVDPRDAHRLRLLGYCQARTNQLEEAVISYTRAIELEPQETYGLGGRGHAYQQMGKWDLAALDYQHALQIDPGFGSAHFGMAEYYFEKGIYADAWDHVKKSQKAGTKVPKEFLDKLKAVMPEPAAPPPWAPVKK